MAQHQRPNRAQPLHFGLGEAQRETNPDGPTHAAIKQAGAVHLPDELVPLIRRLELEKTESRNKRPRIIGLYLMLRQNGLERSYAFYVIRRKA